MVKRQWGTVSTGCESRSFSVNAARFWFPLVSPYKDPTAEAISMKGRVLDGLSEWTSIFLECFEVITSQDLSGYDPVKSYDSWVQIFLVDDNSADVSSLAGERTVSFLIRAGVGEPASREQLILALDKASRGIRPKIEFVLLRDAMRGLLWEHYRRSVIDVSSAFEVALTKSSQTLLERNNGATLARAILQKFQGLSERVRLCGHLGISLPESNYREDVIELRNRVAHKGYIPSRDEAVKAYSICMAAVEALTDSKFE